MVRGDSNFLNKQMCSISLEKEIERFFVSTVFDRFDLQGSDEFLRMLWLRFGVVRTSSTASVFDKALREEER